MINDCLEKIGTQFAYVTSQHGEQTAAATQRLLHPDDRYGGDLAPPDRRRWTQWRHWTAPPTELGKQLQQEGVVSGDWSSPAVVSSGELQPRLGRAGHHLTTSPLLSYDGEWCGSSAAILATAPPQSPARPRPAHSSAVRVVAAAARCTHATQVGTAAVVGLVDVCSVLGAAVVRGPPPSHHQ